MDPADLERQLEELHSAGFAWAAGCCLGNREEAEDVLQEVYLKVLEGRARFGGRSTLKTWLFGVIRKTALDRRRRRALRAALLLRWGWAPRQTTSGAEADTRVARNREAEGVRRALSSLSLRQRQAIELVFFHDLTVREAARAMGVSTGTASRHYDRGKQRLARLLATEAPA